jgi:hypothetical protein
MVADEIFEASFKALLRRHAVLLLNKDRMPVRDDLLDITWET